MPDYLSLFFHCLGINCKNITSHIESCEFLNMLRLKPIPDTTWHSERVQTNDERGITPHIVLRDNNSPLHALLRIKLHGEVQILNKQRSLYRLSNFILLIGSPRIANLSHLLFHQTAL